MEPHMTTATLPIDITPPMTDERVCTIAREFDLRELPADFLANPFPVYAHLREHEPVRWMPDGSLFLTRHADLTTVYKDAATFSSAKHIEFAPKFNIPPYAGGDLTQVAPLYEHHTTSLVFSDPPLHTRVRQLIMGALTRRAIANMEQSLMQSVDGLLDTLADRGHGDLIEDFAAAIPIEVIGNLLGIPVADRGPLCAWSLSILGALEPSLSSDRHLQGNRSVLDMLHYLRGLVAERRRHPLDPQRDVLTRLIQGERALGRLSEPELLHNCIFLLNAGHETTTNLIGNALVLWQEQPIAYAQLLCTVNMVGHNAVVYEQAWGRVVDEVLRLESSNQLGNRRAVCETQIAGVRIPAGTPVTLCIGAANRDPAVFVNPDAPNWEREPNRHLAFGLGIHQCAGLSLARLEGRIALSRFVQRFPNYRLSAPPERGGRARFRGFLRAPFLCGA